MDNPYADIVQGTAEWRAIRCGKVTGSRVADLTATTKSGVSASRARYMGELIAERLTGVRTETFQSLDMLAGKEKEAAARWLYEFRYDVDIQQIGFVTHPKIPMSGASPDGYIGDTGGVELKCPIIATHIETLMTHKCPGNYLKQIQWNMACDGRAWRDYVSFCPEMPANMQFFVKRIPRDAAMIHDLEKQVVAFLVELDAKLCTLQSAYDLTAVLEKSA